MEYTRSAEIVYYVACEWGTF